MRLHVRSTFNESEGTWIREEDEELLEKAIISGVTHDISEAKLTLIGVPDRPGVAARVFRALADAGVNIDMIVQNVSSQGLTDISFTLPKSDLAVAEPILEAGCKDVDAAGWTHDSDVAKVSLIGAGMRSHPGVAADMFEALADAGINIEIISTSSIRISCVVRATDVERAVQAVHDKFQLVAEAARECLVSASSARPAPSGTVTLELLAERGYDDVRAFASERSAGKRVAFGGEALVVEEATPEAFGELDLCLFSIGTIGIAGARRQKRCEPARWWSTSRRRTGSPTACRSSSPR